MLEKGEYIEYNGERYYNEDVEYIDGSIHINREEFRLNEGLGDLLDATICTISVNGEELMNHGIWQKPKKERLPRKLKKRLKKRSEIWLKYYSQALYSRPTLVTEKFMQWYDVFDFDINELDFDRVKNPYKL